jgi:hypothetical protein
MSLLAEVDRSLLLSWYQQEGRQKAEGKRQLAALLGLSDGSLRVRAFRLRERVRHCVDGCTAKKDVTLDWRP